MDSEIRSYIKESFSENKADLLIESFQLLEDADQDDYTNAFNALLMDEGNIDRGDLSMQFESMVYQSVNQIIKLHNVILNEDTPLSMVNQVCRGLLDIEYYLGIDDIVRTIESDLDLEEKFSQIISFTTGIDSEYILPYLEEVNPSLIDRIEELFISKQALDQTELEVDELQFKILSNVKNITRFLQSEDFIAIKLINADVVVGIEFNEYLKYITHELETLTNGAIAKELFVLLSISKQDNESILSIYSKYSNFLFHDLDKVTKVYSLISKIIQEFDRYMLQRMAFTKEAVK